MVWSFIKIWSKLITWSSLQVLNYWSTVRLYSQQSIHIVNITTLTVNMVNKYSQQSINIDSFIVYKYYCKTRWINSGSAPTHRTQQYMFYWALWKEVMVNNLFHQYQQSEPPPLTYNFYIYWIYSNEISVAAIV